MHFESEFDDAGMKILQRNKQHKMNKTMKWK